MPPPPVLRLLCSVDGRFGWPSCCRHASAVLPPYLRRTAHRWMVFVLASGNLLWRRGHRRGAGLPQGCVGGGAGGRCGGGVPSVLRAVETHHRDREARGVFSTWDLFTAMVGYRSAFLPRLHHACVPSRCYKFSLSSRSAKVDWLFVLLPLPKGVSSTSSSIFALGCSSAPLAIVVHPP
ncbi:hypothetical protein GUJ93_ZPchr0006g45904 [Zizania palustris]|uniref:Uncharacterized protein n=1 Tax=Zizania palustris TaxID=103762 RepID=A0A8J5SS27_ZIZPA|nr:hypothetical protein GUJ93_ZPchr0006g45904 [Zizania palustris]